MEHVYLDFARERARHVRDTWFERAEAELWRFAEALNDFLYELEANPTPDWRNRLDGFFAEQATWGREVRPQHQQELIAYLDGWAATIEWGEGESQESSSYATSVTVKQESAPGGSQLAKVAHRRRRQGLNRDENWTEHEWQFLRKMAVAERYLKEIEQILESLAKKLTAAGADTIVVDDEIERIDSLIYAHNDQMEAARAAWLRGNLSSQLVNRLGKARSAASLELPMFVDERQARRAAEQWQEISRRLGQRTRNLDRTIAAMRVLEGAGYAAGLLTGGMLIYQAVQVGGKLAIKRIAVQVAAATVAGLRRRRSG